MQEIIIIGCMDNTVDHTFESANRVYGSGGVAPTIPTCAGGGIQPKVMEIQKIVYNDYNSAVRADQRTMTTLTTNCGATALRNGVKIIEAAALRMVRTEEGKKLRKAYEAHEVHHGYNEHRQAEPRTDGLCNTITTVQKDNHILEVEGIKEKSTVKVRQATKQGYIECELGGGADLNYPNSETRRGRVIENGRVCPTLTTSSNPCVLEKFIYEIDGELYLVRIRKLTPLECWRLMGFSDSDFEKAESVNSNTQLYKQAGNSIVKQVLMSVFSQMIPPQTKVTSLQKKALALLEL